MDDLCEECGGSGWIDKDIEYCDNTVAALVACIDCNPEGEIRQ